MKLKKFIEKLNKDLIEYGNVNLLNEQDLAYFSLEEDEGIIYPEWL